MTPLAETSATQSSITEIPLPGVHDFGFDPENCQTRTVSQLTEDVVGRPDPYQCEVRFGALGLSFYTSDSGGTPAALAELTDNPSYGLGDFASDIWPTLGAVLRAEISAKVAVRTVIFYLYCANRWINASWTGYEPLEKDFRSIDAKLNGPLKSFSWQGKLNNCARAKYVNEMTRPFIASMRLSPDVLARALTSDETATSLLEDLGNSFRGADLSEEWKILVPWDLFEGRVSTSDPVSCPAVDEDEFRICQPPVNDVESSSESGIEVPDSESGDTPERDLDDPSRTPHLNQTGQRTLIRVKGPNSGLRNSYIADSQPPPKQRRNAAVKGRKNKD